MLAALAADPTTNFARRFRSYVKHDLLRDMQRVTELLEQHGCVVDLPPFEFLRAKFPQERWDIQAASQYQTYFIARTRQWEALVADWEGDLLDAMHPPNALLPLSGLLAMKHWAINKGEERQRELIGMTAKAERPQKDWSEQLRQ